MLTPLQITTRRHPLAIAVYALVAVLGFLFITRGIHSAAITRAISPFWVYVWEWSMCVGGALAVIGVFWPRRLDRGLFLESTGATVSMFGMVTYTSVIVYIAGWRNPTWVLMICLTAGLGLRAIQAARDLGKVEVAAMTPMEVFHLPVDPRTDPK
jgi:hypothetical protein